MMETFVLELSCVIHVYTHTHTTATIVSYIYILKVRSLLLLQEKIERFTVTVVWGLCTSVSFGGRQV